MCGRRLKIFLVILALTLPLYSAQSEVSSSPLDELLTILTDYEEITTSLETRLNSFESSLSQLETSTNRIKSDIKALEVNSTILTESLNAQEKILTGSVETLNSFETQINDLESGYQSMEKKLKLWTAVSNVSIGIALTSILLLILQ